MLTPEIERKFDDAVAFCRQLQDENRIGSGYRVVIHNGMIKCESIPPAVSEDETFDFKAFVRSYRSKIQAVRASLSRWFDLDADSWNASATGRMLKYIEAKFREETYHVEDDKVYNSDVMYGTATEMTELAKLLLSERFHRRYRTRLSKFRALNQHADEFFAREQNRANFRSVSILAQTIIGMDELRRERGSDEAVDELIRKVMETDVIAALKLCFPQKASA